MQLRLLSVVVLMLGAAPALAASEEKPAFCVNQNAEFYPYKSGQNCKTSYQLADGNCKLKDGETIAVEKSACASRGGEIVLPSPAALLPVEPDPKQPPTPQPLKTPKPQG